MWSGVLYIGATLVVCITHWVYSWRNPKCNGKLPPGSMGLPIVGETIQFFAPYTSSDIQPFIKKRMKRYGPVFRTSLVGRPMIVSTDSGINHFIFQQEGHLFQSWYPETFTEIFGQQNLTSLNDFMHKHVKNMVLTLFGPESLKEKLFLEVEQTAHRYLSLWEIQKDGTVELKEGIETMIFDLTAKKLISYKYEPTKCSEHLRENFAAFIQGLVSFPLNIPGTAYYKCLQGRKKAMKMLKDMLQERRAMPKMSCQGDFYDYVIEEMNKKGTFLTEPIVLDLMFVLLFASYETTSLALTLGIKFLTDHPHVLKELTVRENLMEEHEAIIRSRGSVDSELTWKEYKSMTFTAQVINEIVRLANIAPGIFRKASSDVQIKGYTFPKGWAVMVCPPAVHLDPAKYEDPLVFNPWRWKGIELHGASKHFMAFGGGMRFCVGADFAKVQMAIFLHLLVTKYRWVVVKGGDIVRNPGLSFPNGFHVQLTKKHK